MKPSLALLITIALLAPGTGCAAPGTAETAAPVRDPRLDWWREARFGLFVHWGLYAIPAGRWGDETGHGEWIRTTAQIPLDEYDRLLDRFDPQAFDADEWARLADEAGMKYVVITSKHHDGFALFDSAVSGFDVMATPWRQDIMKEIARAFSARGLRPCWYHSIMDWHHPDYLPRRGWEVAGRPADGADMDRFVEYLHAQVTELLTNYGPIGVMWFDGEWENTWSHERGQALYDLCRRLQPDVIVNNRVDVGRGGMAGLTEGPGYAGDFGTPEQEVPATGLPGVDWESCITMNAHWGWNESDPAWKSTTELVRLLVDVVSKGGNLLLNVGPRADGSFPPQAVERLRGIGRWMDLHGEAIHGTAASPFAGLPWGRCTTRRDGSDTRLFLHVFDWPEDGRLVVPGIGNDYFRATLLADGRPLSIERAGPDLWIWLPERPTDPDCPVVDLRVDGEPLVYLPPVIEADGESFVDRQEVRLASATPGLEVRYRLDGGEPTAADPIARRPLALRESATVAARAFHRGEPVSPTVRRAFFRVEPRPAAAPPARAPLTAGLLRTAFSGEWERLPDWTGAAGEEAVVVERIELGDFRARERVGLRFAGWMRIPADGMWSFELSSDDGARLSVGGQPAVDNDGLHSANTVRGDLALRAGWHAFELLWFNRTGGAELGLTRRLRGGAASPIPAGDLAVRLAEASD